MNTMSQFNLNPAQGRRAQREAACDAQRARTGAGRLRAGAEAAHRAAADDGRCRPRRRTTQSPGSIFNPGYAGRPLFEDQRPRNIGDILTIVIQENVNATKSSGANTNRSSATSFSYHERGFLSGLFGKANLNAQGSNAFQGTGGANASNTFNGVITVTVTNVLPNGNLVVSGEKQMLINQGNEFVRFSGVVNPNTISGLNAVYSTQVADAKIEYSAKGYIDEAETMSWLQRFFLNVSPW